MQLRDIVSRLSIDQRKLTAYVLDPDNPIGRHKALVFERRLGFAKDNHALLVRQIESQVLDAEASLQRTDQYGRHYRVDLEIIGVLQQREVVRTGWLVASGDDAAQLVTCYVRRRK